MKKIITISVIAIYLSLSVGLNVLLHTCGDYTNAYVMPISVEDPCTNNGSHGCCSQAPCCKLELKIFHINDSQLQTQNPQPENVFLQNAINPAKEHDVLLRSLFSPIVLVDTSPPRNTPQYILDRTFLI